MSQTEPKRRRVDKIHEAKKKGGSLFLANIRSIRNRINSGKLCMELEKKIHVVLVI